MTSDFLPPGPTSDVVLRPARADDLPRLGPIERAADRRFEGTPYTVFLDGDAIPPGVAARALADGRLTVAERGGEVVGWLCATRLGGEVCVGQVSVLPAHGRRGIGTALLRDLLDRARAAGEPSVVLITQADIPWNAPWYERHGFAIVPTSQWGDAMHAEARRSADLDWSQRVLMRCDLRDGLSSRSAGL